MKGGSEDVDTPREILNPRKITFSERHIFSGGFSIPTHSHRRPQVVRCKSFTKQCLFLMYLLGKQRKSDFAEIYWNIFSHNFANFQILGVANASIIPHVLKFGDLAFLQNHSILSGTWEMCWIQFYYVNPPNFTSSRNSGANISAKIWHNAV